MVNSEKKDDLYSLFTIHKTATARLANITVYQLKKSLPLLYSCQFSWLLEL